MNGMFDGIVMILDKPLPDGQLTITLNGQTADVLVGGNGQIGAVALRNTDDKEIARMGHIPPGQPKGAPGTKAPPHARASGAIVLKSSAGKERILLNATSADLVLGGNGLDGRLSLTGKEGDKRIRISGGDDDNIVVRHDSPKKKRVFTPRHARSLAARLLALCRASAPRGAGLSTASPRLTVLKGLI